MNKQLLPSKNRSQRPVRSTAVLLLAVLGLCALAAGGVAAGAGTVDAGAPDAPGFADPAATDYGEVSSTSQSDDPADNGTADEASTVTVDDIPDPAIDAELRTTEGTVDAIVYLEDPDRTAVAQSEDPTAIMKAHADRSKDELRDLAERRDDVEIKTEFWITNAALVEADADALDAIADLDRVRAIEPNREVQLIEPVTNESATTQSAKSNGAATDKAESDDVSTAAPSTTSTTTTTDNVTYGLDQVNAPEAWEQIGTRGEGAKVAILDTGVDPDHPDIDLYTEDPDDPTYPGGFAEFSSDGDRVEGAEARDTHYHGTHVSATATGGDASGTAIGVAPDATLIHGAVIPSGYGTSASVIAGIEWAVEENADVIGMSLGTGFGQTEYIEPIRNARAAGTVVVVSNGNSGEGTSGSPADPYDTVSVGASNEDEDIADFSSGRTIDTDSRWGSDAPEDWPEEYVTPQVSAPGVDVESAMPGDDYSELSGTSMASPHVAGVYALMYSANAGLTPDVADQAIEKTTFKPEDAPEEPDVRYGHGIVDALNATARVAGDAQIEGTVTHNGTPIEGATVQIDQFQLTTDENGTFSFPVQEGDYEIEASAFGYRTTSTNVTAVANETTTVSLEPNPVVDVAIESEGDDILEGGESTTDTFRVANLESLTVETEGDYTNATLSVEGEAYQFGESIDFDGHDGTVNVTIETANLTDGEFQPVYTVAGANESIERSTTNRTVHRKLIEVGVIGDGYSEKIASTLRDTASRTGVPIEVSVPEGIEKYGRLDAYVVNSLEGSDVRAFLDVTQTDEVGVVYLEQWGGSDAIAEYAEETGDPETVMVDDFADTPAFYEVESDHELLDGVGQPGDRVPIVNAEFGEHAWFDGTDMNVVASVGTPDRGVVGSALAANRENGTVLAASLGRGRYTGDDLYTNESNRILLNAVEFAAPSPELTVTDVETTGSVETGDTVNVTATVENTGYEGDASVALEYEGTKLETTEQWYEPNDTATFTFAWNATQVRPGSYTLTIDAGAERQDIEIDVVPDGGAMVSDVTLEDDYAPGATANATVELVNYGNSTVEDTLSYGLDGTDASVNVSLAPDERTNETVTMSLPENRTAAAATFDYAGHQVRHPIAVGLPDAAMGDVDGSGKRTVDDVIAIQFASLGIDPTKVVDEFDQEVADVDRDGSLTVDDVISTQFASLGLNDGASLNVSVDSDDTVAADGAMTVDVTIQNEGDIGTIEAVDLRIAPETYGSAANTTVGSTTVDLGPGEETTRSFQVDPGTLDLAPGDYQLSVAGDTGEATATVTVESGSE